VLPVCLQDDDEDEMKSAFLGLMREKRDKKSMLGQTAKRIIAEQIHRSLFAKGGYHWKDDRDDVDPFLWEIYRTKLSTVINANSKASVPKDAFHVDRGTGKLPEREEKKRIQLAARLERIRRSVRRARRRSRTRTQRA
jgi:two-component SAPR family response regulator